MSKKPTTGEKPKQGEGVRAGVKDVNQAEFVRALSAHLKKGGKLKVPEWADSVKLGRHNELGPIDDDWFFTRAAAVLRHIYVRSPVGVGSLTRIFGGRLRRGSKPAHYRRGSSSVARKALQSLEALGLVENMKDGKKAGRVLTKEGRRDLDRIAASLASDPKSAIKRLI